ncbi:MAG TPA: ABC-type transport auxiliary lipoprotein family protein, partial [Candidatus Methylomirabilis sp.]|nr:ABC-type transport auxiliary lipoprotein family protein [Candidatus Methylomirabilis sp.]
MKAVGFPLSELKLRSLPPAAAAFGLVVVLVWASCGSAPRTHYYTLQTPSAPLPSDATTNLVLGVEHFRGPDIMRDDRIVYYQSSTQLNFYQQHRWSADPTAMLAEMCQRWLEQKGVFAQVRLAPYRDPVDYTLRGRVSNFEEVDDPGRVKGRV